MGFCLFGFAFLDRRGCRLGCSLLLLLSGGRNVLEGGPASRCLLAVSGIAFVVSVVVDDLRHSDHLHVACEEIRV